MSSQWFDDVTVAGKMTPTDLAAKLTPASAARPTEPPRGGVVPPTTPAVPPVETTRGLGDLFKRLFGGGPPQPWQHTGHVFGFLEAPQAAVSQPLPLVQAGSIEPDVSLKNARVKVTLDRLRIMDYPGGEQRILFDFNAQNQAENNTENLHFNGTYRVREGETAALVGFPIFVGLTVGSNGVMFRCYTVAVGNSQDEALLRVLESDVFRMGLQLIETAQPAIVPFSSLAFEFTRTVAKRNQNVAVQDINLGLDFTRNPFGARLREGSYVVVQAPDAEVASWDWGKYVFNPANGQVVRSDKLNEMIPYNYFVFSVYKYE